MRHVLKEIVYEKIQKEATFTQTNLLDSYSPGIFQLKLQ